MLADVAQAAGSLAEGFSKFGPYSFGLSVALAGLGMVFGILMSVLLRTIRDQHQQLRESSSRADAIQEKRIADRDAFQAKLEALARESNRTSEEMVHAISELARQVAERRPRASPRAVPLPVKPPGEAAP